MLRLGAGTCPHFRKNGSLFQSFLYAFRRGARISGVSVIARCPQGEIQLGIYNFGQQSKTYQNITAWGTATCQNWVRNQKSSVQDVEKIDRSRSILRTRSLFYAVRIRFIIYYISTVIYTQNNSDDKIVYHSQSATWTVNFPHYSEKTSLAASDSTNDVFFTKLKKPPLISWSQEGLWTSRDVGSVSQRRPRFGRLIGLSQQSMALLSRAVIQRRLFFHQHKHR